MPTVETDTTLGKIIYSDKVLAKMRKYGLYRFHILDTLKHGFNVTSLIPNTYQRTYLAQQNKQVSVIFTVKNRAGKPLGAIRLITCWARPVK